MDGAARSSLEQAAVSEDAEKSKVEEAETPAAQGAGEGAARRQALIVSVTLRASTYATMFIRELLKVRSGAALVVRFRLGLIAAHCRNLDLRRAE
jgi:tRNA(Glu) U13 pseudouridine synthase TruD